MVFSGNEIRTRFLKYFEKHQHEIVKSAGLIPQNDPTLFFTNAGMVPFKNVFVGEEKRPYSRATTSQKCLRVSGKHNDLENVGRTARHHTFFEMLGNFSFGDYFKKEAIRLAWEFLTVELGFDKNRLWITVFENDDEAEKIWMEQEKIPQERIFRLGEKDNFWSMGETGPCGPCSEIHYQFDDCTPYDAKHGKDWFLENSESGKIMEIWNLVFMQFERSADGKLLPLPKPSIDTGMGLERVTSILQNKCSNYDTDFFQPLIEAASKIAGVAYGKNNESDISLRVIADHIRSSVFLISDGVLPSNEGRGYVLRRIMRRAIRHGRLLGQNEPFFFKIAPVLIEEMKEAYPDLVTNKDTISKVLQAEETRFFETLDKGLKILAEEMEQCRKNKSNTLSGAATFKLYDTYGFPLDLTQIIAEENNLHVDEIGFEKCLNEQKERARAAWKGSGEEKISEVYLNLASKHKTKFLGYDTLEAPGKVLAIIQDGKLISEISAKAHGQDEFEILFDQTPCYGEGGGQVGDSGEIFSSEKIFGKILNTQKPGGDLFIHKVRAVGAKISVGDTLQIKVDRPLRLATMRNHSATHLLHAVLRKILGAHVRQAGSLVTSELLRFDFTHFEGISDTLLRKIEDEVNEAILASVAITKKESSYDEAVADGALAFFGDKYGDLVRVVGMGNYSVELCGGTHLNNTSEIAFFKILSEGSVAAGVRRIEAITGKAAMEAAQNEAAVIKSLALSLKAQPKEMIERVEKLKNQIKSLERDIEQAKRAALSGKSEDFLKNIFEKNGVKALVHSAEADSPKALGEVADLIMSKMNSGIVVTHAVIDDKVSLIVSVTKDLVAKYKANEILKPLSELIGGRGGGKPDRAQAGGPETSRLGEIRAVLENIL